MFEVSGNFREPINKKEIEKTVSILSAIFKLNMDLNKAFQTKDIVK